MNDENKIKKIIKDQEEQYEIKTKSSDILSRYLKEKETKEEFVPLKHKKPIYKTTGFKVAVPVFSVALIALVSIPFIVKSTDPNLPPPINNIVIPLNNKAINMASMELVAGVSFFESPDKNVDIISKMRRKSEENVTKVQFEDAVKTFDKYYYMLENIDEYKNESSTYTPVESDDESYPYCIKINDFYFYYNSKIEKETDEDEVETQSTIDGYIKLDDDKTYKVKIEKEEEQEEKESEVETKTTIYYDDSSYLTIEKEQEIEGQEKEEEFSLKEYKNNKIFTDINFDTEDNEQELVVNYDEGIETEKEYLISSDTDTYLKFNYEFEDVEINDITLDKKTHTYSYKSYSYK